MTAMKEPTFGSLIGSVGCLRSSRKGMPDGGIGGCEWEVDVTTGNLC
jgi:hypothetical protein